MTEPLLKTQNLTKHFQLSSNALVQAVDDISLEIAPREILGLVGGKRKRQVDVWQNRNRSTRQDQRHRDV